MGVRLKFEKEANYTLYKLFDIETVYFSGTDAAAKKTGGLNLENSCRCVYI